MQNHFKKLNTPLLSLLRYPSLRAQAKRFLAAGYNEVETCDLNTFYYGVMQADERNAALQLELFDEYEELGAFLCHYFVLLARNMPSRTALSPLSGGWEYISWGSDTFLNGIAAPSNRCHISPSPESSSKLVSLTSLPRLQRRFAATSSSRLGFLFQGGLSPTTRLSTSTKLLRGSSTDKIRGCASPPSRMCHTMTSLGDGRVLLVGGREAPQAGLSDSWIYDTEWRKIENIPGGGIYRHCAATVNSDAVVVFGGRRDGGKVSSSWYLYKTEQGWREISCVGDVPPLWGASLSWANDCGVLLGGVDAEGDCLGDVYAWTLDQKTLTVTLKKWSLSEHERSLTRRYGAKLIPWTDGEFLLVGGAGSHRCLPWSDQFVILSPVKEPVRLMDLEKPPEGEPWLIGHDVAVQEKTGEIVVLGGGGVSFSFGSFWNEKIMTLRGMGLVGTDMLDWKLFDIPPSRVVIPKLLSSSTAKESRPIRRVKLTSPAHWTNILNSSEVTILEGLNFGSCTTKWTSAYLKSRVPAEKQVIIHSTESNAMNFLSKNFKYTPCLFAKVIDAVFADNNEKVYLRAVSDDAKNKPAKLEDDFPGLADDFMIPEILRGDNGIPSHRIFSTVLRIGSVGTNMWLHHDVSSCVATLIPDHGKYSHANCWRKRDSGVSSLER
jgi:tRNA wybutosine-synthesizing protein 4